MWISKGAALIRGNTVCLLYYLYYYTPRSLYIEWVLISAWWKDSMSSILTYSPLCQMHRIWNVIFLKCSCYNSTKSIEFEAVQIWSTFTRTTKISLSRGASKHLLNKIFLPFVLWQMRKIYLFFLYF